MKQGTLLRILILAIGLYVLSGSITGIFSSLWALKDYRFLDPLTRDYQMSILIGYGLFPLLVSSILLFFSQRIERFFLGGQSDIVLPSVNLDAGTVLKAALRVLGIYFFCTYGSAMAATIYEMIAFKAGNQQFTEAQVTADTIANGVGLALASALCFKTPQVIALISEKQ